MTIAVPLFTYRDKSVPRDKSNVLKLREQLDLFSADVLKDDYGVVSAGYDFGMAFFNIFKSLALWLFAIFVFPCYGPYRASKSTSTAVKEQGTPRAIGARLGMSTWHFFRDIFLLPWRLLVLLWECVKVLAGVAYVAILHTRIMCACATLPCCVC